MCSWIYRTELRSLGWSRVGRDGLGSKEGREEDGGKRASHLLLSENSPHRGTTVLRNIILRREIIRHQNMCQTTALENTCQKQCGAMKTDESQPIRATPDQRVLGTDPSRQMHDTETPENSTERLRCRHGEESPRVKLAGSFDVDRNQLATQDMAQNARKLPCKEGQANPHFQEGPSTTTFRATGIVLFLQGT